MTAREATEMCVLLFSYVHDGDGGWTKTELWVVVALKEFGKFLKKIPERHQGNLEGVKILISILNRSKLSKRKANIEEWMGMGPWSRRSWLLFSMCCWWVRFDDTATAAHLCEMIEH